MKYALLSIIIFSIVLYPAHVSNAEVKHEKNFKTAKAIITYEKVKHDLQVKQFFMECRNLKRSIIKIQEKIKR